MDEARRSVSSGPPWPWRLLLGFVVSALRHLFGWRIRARRPDTAPSPETPLVVVFNHTSNIDPFLVAHLVWKGLGHWCQPLTKAELFDVPVLGLLARGAGAIPVHRGDDAKREAAYADAVACLREGGTILLAPEGTVTHDGSLLPMRHGAARLALEAGAEVLVVTHFGAQRAFSPVRTWPERDVLVTMAVDVLSPWADEDAAGLTGRIAATMLDRSEQLRDAYPVQDADAPWWPPYSRPASPSETARDNLERYRDSMAEAIANARERMSRFAEDHEVEQRLAHAREQVERAREQMERAREQLAHAREQFDHTREQARDRLDHLSAEMRERAEHAGWLTPRDEELEVLRYAAFTTDPAGGNPAGVVLAEELPDNATMQAIARDVGYSETAFVAPRPDGSGHDVRYWSPEREVTFCGHATIGAGVAMAERDPTLAGITLHTRSEIVRMETDTSGGVSSARFSSPPARHRAVEDAVLDTALAAFGWDRSVLADDVPAVVAHAGADHLVLPLADRSTLAAMDYDYEDLRELMLREGWTTVAVIHRESADLIHARNPFPVGGVVEDPATGAAAAAVGGLLRDLDLLPADGRFTIRQGEDLGRPSVLEVDALVDAPRVAVGGPAVPIR